MNAIELRGVTRRYGENLALDNVSFVVPSGSIFGLVGANGAGKTTCLNIVTTLLPPSAGDVLVCGSSVTCAPRETRRRVGYAPEEPLLYDGLTASEFVCLSGRLHGLEGAEALERAAEQLAGFDLSAQAEHQVGSFSKGMRRKVLIAASLAHDPDLLVLDEPLEGLDVIAQKRLKDLLRERADRGRTVFYSTHIVEVVEALCTHVAILRAGKLSAVGTIPEVLDTLQIRSLMDAFGRGAS